MVELKPAHLPALLVAFKRALVSGMIPVEKAQDFVARLDDAVLEARVELKHRIPQDKRP